MASVLQPARSRSSTHKPLFDAASRLRGAEARESATQFANAVQRQVPHPDRAHWTMLRAFSVLPAVLALGACQSPLPAMIVAMRGELERVAALPVEAGVVCPPAPPAPVQPQCRKREGDDFYSSWCYGEYTDPSSENWLGRVSVCCNCEYESPWDRPSGYSEACADWVAHARAVEARKAWEQLPCLMEWRSAHGELRTAEGPVSGIDQVTAHPDLLPRMPCRNGGAPSSPACSRAVPCHPA